MQQPTYSLFAIFEGSHLISREWSLTEYGNVCFCSDLNFEDNVKKKLDYLTTFTCADMHDGMFSVTKEFMQCM